MEVEDLECRSAVFMRGKFVFLHARIKTDLMVLNL